jgi:hypothetical protein
MTAQTPRPILREDLRKGDVVIRTVTGRYRAVSDGGDVISEADNVSAVTYELIERIEPLPTASGSVVRWRDGAYLPQIAQLDAGHMGLGWRVDENDDPRWVTADQLRDLMGAAPFAVLRPEAEVANEVLAVFEARFNRPGQSVNSALANTRTEYGVPL